MKKYSEYLKEQYTPLSRDELDEMMYINDPTYGMKGLMKEINYLRSLLDAAYEFIGRKPVKPSPIRYNDVLAEAYRIHREDKEVNQ